MPWWAERMDGHYKHFARHTPHLTRKPSEHMRGERCFFTFDPDEAMLPEAMRLLGVPRLMWASDYPHFDAEFPDAAEIVVNNPRLSPMKSARSSPTTRCAFSRIAASQPASFRPHRVRISRT